MEQRVYLCFQALVKKKPAHQFFGDLTVDPKSVKKDSFHKKDDPSNDGAGSGGICV